MDKHGVLVGYKCACMEQEREVLVPYRREGEDVVSWMVTFVQGTITIDHRFLSPQCDSGTMDYAKVPMGDDENRLGMIPIPKEFECKGSA